ncbi:unnamed protein product [Bemisia tabaci]|uniref:Acyl carrier protein n=1 Tax=Bemisia tabaci TaxID=7038 RepID=A0A9N9ZWY8_BEMTA|nr:unnamed protein product [Bemisia tabaci]
MAVAATHLRQTLLRSSCLFRKSALKLAPVTLQPCKFFHSELLKNLRATSCPSLISQNSQVSLKISQRCYSKYDDDDRHPIHSQYRNTEERSIYNVENRVMKVLKAYDRITADKLTLDSHFINDIGLDSLDHVEVIMAMEDEFGFEIPDGDAEKLLRPKDIIQYIADHEDIYE